MTEFADIFASYAAPHRSRLRRARRYASPESRLPDGTRSD
jgi:hypothetical protein